MKEIDLAAQTLFAELLQRSLDAEFDSEYGENGAFVRKKTKDRDALTSCKRAGGRPTGTPL